MAVSFVHLRATKKKKRTNEWRWSDRKVFSSMKYFAFTSINLISCITGSIQCPIGALRRHDEEVWKFLFRWWLMDWTYFAWIVRIPLKFFEAFIQWQIVTNRILWKIFMQCWLSNLFLHLTFHFGGALRKYGYVSVIQW